KCLFDPTCTEIVRGVNSQSESNANCSIGQVKKMVSDRTGIARSQQVCGYLFLVRFVRTWRSRNWLTWKSQKLCWQGRELKNGQTLASYTDQVRGISVQLFVSSSELHTGFTIEAVDDRDSKAATALIASVSAQLSGFG